MTRTEELTDFVCAAAILFLCAEEGHNPSVRTYWDALHYVSTSLSVGYANIFPATQAGRAIGAVVQMLGPALSSRALDTDRPDRMDEVLAELRKVTALLPARAVP
jgi:voltage-gated potassium channel